MGSLYVVGVPAGDPGDLTRRALRILREVDLIVASDVEAVQGLLDYHHVAVPLMAAAGDATLAALTGGDVALVSPGWSLGLDSAARRLIGSAAGHGFAIVPVPGPALPVTALVISGFPADSFVYLGGLPQQRPARRALLTSIAAERRTIVVVEQPSQLSAIHADLHGVLGDRPAVLVVASEQGTGMIWRGTLGEMAGQAGEGAQSGHWALVIAGVRDQPARWAEERLRAEIESRRAQGLGAGEIGRQLAVESGWSRREIYRLVIEPLQPGAGIEEEA